MPLPDLNEQECAFVMCALDAWSEVLAQQSARARRQVEAMVLPPVGEIDPAMDVIREASLSASRQAEVARNLARRFEAVCVA